jgi:heat-inducible transcriptional repressor
MTSRQQKIVIRLIELYQQTAEPVGSEALAKQGHFTVSAPTLRNELAVLEKEGYVKAPHTSAGRVPTLKSYVWYMEKAKQGRELAKEEKARFDKLKMINTDEFRYCREIAKQLAEMSGEAVFMAFGPYSTYYTGLTNLLAKPELKDRRRTTTLGQVLDRLDEILQGLIRRAQIKNEVEVLLGEDSPFGKDFGSLLIHFSHKEIEHGIMGILGLLRMDWEKNMGLMKYMSQLLSTQNSNVKTQNYGIASR